MQYHFGKNFLIIIYQFLFPSSSVDMVAASYLFLTKFMVNILKIFPIILNEMNQSTMAVLNNFTWQLSSIYSQTIDYYLSSKC